MEVLNINVGVLGHVDCGKTSLAKALSMVASTSAFDKNPQSKKRGITLDLGFSSFLVDLSNFPVDTPFRQDYKQIQFTLVDCPGHSSLIRTVLCGSQIIDIMLLVIDITKGFQTQTSECLVIGEITCNQMIVVLNKSDLLREDTRSSQVEKMKKRVQKTLDQTKFRGSPICVLSAAPGGVQEDFQPNSDHSPKEDLKDLIRVLVQTVSDPKEKRRQVSNRGFLFAVDHCFAVTGQGTVMTGTVLTGGVRVGEMIELPHQRIQRKIKSIQMFHQPVNFIGPGDRAGICVPQLDPSLLERGLAGSPGGNLQICHACVLGDVQRITYFKSPVLSKARFHVFIGQETVLAQLTFFSLSSAVHAAQESESDLDLEQNFLYLPELPVSTDKPKIIWVLLEFERPVVCYTGAAVIGAKLDSTSTTACRLAFYGKVQKQMTDPQYKQNILPQLCIYRCKTRRGHIDRVIDSRTCVVRGLFKRETNWDIFVGLRAHIDEDNGDVLEKPRRIASGRIESSFGQSGKCRFALDDDLPAEVVTLFARKPGKKGDAPSAIQENSKSKFSVILEFKRFLFDPKRRLVQ